MVSTQPANSPDTQIASDEIDLRELFRTIWAGRWIIMVVTAAFLGLASLYLHNATYRYTAELTLTPAQSGGGAKLAGLGGLASLAGINIPQGQEELSFSLYAEGVHSRGLAEALAAHPDLMRVIFSNEWNEETGQWQQPRGFVSSTIAVIKNLLGAPTFAWSPPDGARLQEFLQREVEVAQDPKNPFLTLRFNHKDPAFAVRFLNTLNNELDNILRRKALERSTGNIAYLSSQLERVTLAEHRAAIAESLSEQEKQRMAASSSAPYAADPFGSANASLRPTSPRPSLVLVASVLGGIIFGSLLVLVRSSYAAFKHMPEREEASA
ncbi:MAG: Wzz/FepE/Etk N-terminal domain-containing protein [Sphingomonadaceae bacterium]